MNRFFRLLLIGLSLLLMGAMDLPRPCIGDGQGNSCSVESCLCAALCTCQTVCRQERGGVPQKAEKRPAQAPMCSALKAPPEQAPCHVQGAPSPETGVGHFSLPEPKPAMLLGSLPRIALMPLAPADAQPYEPSGHPSMPLSPPEPPPRIRA